MEKADEVAEHVSHDPPDQALMDGAESKTEPSVQDSAEVVPEGMYPMTSGRNDNNTGLEHEMG